MAIAADGLALGDAAGLGVATGIGLGDEDGVGDALAERAELPAGEAVEPQPVAAAATRTSRTVARRARRFMRDSLPPRRPRRR
ncbi:MAG: hypothetical protein E6H96_00595 [Chloroflexi bacterium]|nr:MAG: hypothetical protein E6H96_00595 [Chloroflexota bacterium]